MQNAYVNKRGFTIVELLIVIVVIAILAAISIAAYTNFQQRAKNTAIINAASQSLKMIQVYIAEHGEYPAGTWSCITSDSGCETNGSIQAVNATFDANMSTIGTLPRSVPVEGTGDYGITYVYYGPITFNGESQPAQLRYYLFGRDQKCQLSNVMKLQGGITSETGYTSSSASKTRCHISIPGPTHS